VNLTHTNELNGYITHVSERDVYHCGRGRILTIRRIKITKEKEDRAGLVE
jgi:hypothetical protein